MSLRPTFPVVQRLMSSFGVAVLVLTGPIAPAFSQSAAATVAGDTAAEGMTPLVVVDGFRSAKFGMDQDAVRAAILADFEIKDDGIQSGENAVERTQILTVAVPNLILDGGTAQVSYVFGYESKTLIQVGATWSTKTDPEVTAKMLYDNGDVLRTHFMTEGYVPETVKTNVALPNGILMFRGADAENHATLLLLQGAFTTGEDGRNTLTPASLDLLYSSDPDTPDIFTLPEGSF
jgi:hypothetical protein